jgi:uncharacterized protein YbjT (DUF2867 family)
MRTAAVFGTTGLIGGHIINLLSNHNGYQKIYSFARRKSDSYPSKVEHVDFSIDTLKIPETVDDVFVCLGTTMKKAGSKEAFRKVDYELVVEIAKQAKVTKVKHFMVVSSLGADPQTGNFYLKTKGEMEEDVKKLGFEYCGIVRPSLLLGERKEFRFGEKIGIVLFNIFSFIFVGPIKKYKGIKAEDVAKSMIMMAQNGTGIVTVESNILKQIADEYGIQ